MRPMGPSNFLKKTEPSTRPQCQPQQIRRTIRPTDGMRGQRKWKNLKRD
jgi:hypothetical protein